MEKSNSRIETLRKFLEEDPADDFSAYALALEFEKTGETKAAISQLEHIIHRNKDYLAAYYQLGNLLGKENEPAKAAAVYSRGMEVAARQKNQKTLNELRSALEMLD